MPEELLPTVRIVVPGHPEPFVEISERDFDPSVHVRYQPAPGNPPRAPVVPHDPSESHGTTPLTGETVTVTVTDPPKRKR